MPLPFVPGASLGPRPAGEAFRASAADAPEKRLCAVRLARREDAASWRANAALFAARPEIVCPDVAEDDAGQAWIVRPWVDAPTLGDLQRDGKLPANLPALGRRIGSALDALHQAGLVHGNLHPDNVCVFADRVVFLDPHPPAPAAFLPARLIGGSVDTRMGTTLDYLSPEQRDGAAPTADSDRFALGVILYRLASGKMPLGIFPRSTEWPPPWPALLESCLQRAPAARPQGLTEFLEGAQPVAVVHSGTSPFMVLLFLFGGALLLTGLVWLTAATWEWLPESFRAQILNVATVMLFFGAYRANETKYRATALTLSIIGALLLPADAAYLLYQSRQEDSLPHWIAAMGIISALCLGAEAYFKAGVHGVLAALAFGIFGILVGEHWSTGDTVGAVIYCTGIGFAGLAAYLGLEKLRLRGSWGFAALLPLYLGPAYCVNFVNLDHPSSALAFGIAYPLVLAPALFLVWRFLLAGRGPRDGLAVAVLLQAFLAASVAPAIFPLVVPDVAPLYPFAVVLGAGSLGVLGRGRSRVEALGLPGWTSSLAGVCGLGLLLFSPFFLPLVHHDDAGYFWVGLVVFVATYAYGVWQGERDPDGIPNLVLCASLIAFHGVLLILGGAFEKDFLYPGLGLAGSILVMADAYRRQWKLPFLFSGFFLAVNAFEQYVTKLSDVLPWYLVAIGLGVGMLVVGVGLEKQRRGFVQKLKTWK